MVSRCVGAVLRTALFTAIVLCTSEQALNAADLPPGTIHPQSGR